MRVLMLLALSLFVWSMVAGSNLSTEMVDQKPVKKGGDLGLYERVVEGVRSGGNYYDVVMHEHLAGPYATSPPTAIRTPVLTYIHVILGDFAPWLLAALAILVILVLLRETEVITKNRLEWYVAIACSAIAFGMYANPSAAYFHEAWAAVLMVLSMFLASKNRIVWAATLGLLAVSIRELAAPFLVLMLIFHFRSGWRRWVPWLASLSVFSALYALHWRAAVDASKGLTALVSPPWMVFGGWPHAVDAFMFSGPLRVLPFAVSAIVLPLAILGWISVDAKFARLVSVTVLAFWVFFCLAGRVQNAYWGHLVASITLVGLAFAPRAFRIAFGPSTRSNEGPDVNRR